MQRLMRCVSVATMLTEGLGFIASSFLRLPGLHGTRSHVPLMMPLGIPKVPYKLPGARNADWINIYDQLYNERLIFLGQQVDDTIVNQIILMMLYSDSESPGLPLSLYINSPGGSVVSGLALYDCMQYVSSPVVTVNIGMAASTVISHSHSQPCLLTFTSPCISRTAPRHHVKT